jgi:hypothetical protein
MMSLTGEPAGGSGCLWVEDSTLSISDGGLIIAEAKHSRQQPEGRSGTGVRSTSSREISMPDPAPSKGSSRAR